MRNGTSTFKVTLVAATFFALAANAGAAVPYKWTAAQVAKQTRSTRCAVVLQGFKCVAGGKPLYVKIRPWGTGLVCKSRLSFSRIPPVCLAPPKVDESDPAAFVRVAIQQKIDPHPGQMWQAFTGSCQGSRGVYTCTSTGSVTVPEWVKGWAVSRARHHDMRVWPQQDPEGYAANPMPVAQQEQYIGEGGGLPIDMIFTALLGDV